MLFDLENYKDILKKENRKALMLYSIVFSILAISIIGIIAIFISTLISDIESEIQLISNFGFIAILGLITLIVSFISNGIYFSALYRGNKREYITNILKLFIKGAGMIFLSFVYSITLLIPLLIYIILVILIAPYFSTSILLLLYFLTTVLIGIFYLILMILIMITMQAEYAKEESLQKALNFKKIIKTAIRKDYAIPIFFNFVFVILSLFAFSIILNMILKLLPIDMGAQITEELFFFFIIFIGIITLLNTLFQMIMIIGFNVSVAKIYNSISEKETKKKIIKKKK